MVRKNNKDALKNIGEERNIKMLKKRNKSWVGIFSGSDTCSNELKKWKGGVEEEK